MKRKKKIIITGALGQDGIILTKKLLKKNFKIYGIIKSDKNIKLKIRKVIYKKLDLTKSNLIKKNLSQIDPEYLVHLGSENPSFHQRNEKKFYELNFRIIKNLIDYFSMNIKKKLIIIGSSQMYSGNIKKINLKTLFKPKNHYAKFRSDSFKYMLEAKRKYKCNIVMAILFNHDSIYRNKKFLIPRLIKMIKDKQFKKLNLIYKKNISADFSHADDICNGLLNLINLKTNINKIILSSNKRTKVNDIIEFILKKRKVKKEFYYNKTKYQHQPIGDNSYSKKILKWTIKKNIFIAVSELNKVI